MVWRWEWWVGWNRNEEIPLVLYVMAPVYSAESPGKGCGEVQEMASVVTHWAYCGQLQRSCWRLTHTFPLCLGGMLLQAAVHSPHPLSRRLHSSPSRLRFHRPPHRPPRSCIRCCRRRRGCPHSLARLAPGSAESTSQAPAAPRGRSSAAVAPSRAPICRRCACQTATCPDSAGPRGNSPCPALTCCCCLCPDHVPSPALCPCPACSGPGLCSVYL